MYVYVAVLYEEDGVLTTRRYTASVRVVVTTLGSLNLSTWNICTKRDMCTYILASPVVGEAFVGEEGVDSGVGPVEER